MKLRSLLRSPWVLPLLLFATLAGCNSGQDGQRAVPVLETAPDSPSTTPISAQAAARVIDLRTFPRPEGADVQTQKLSELQYTAPGSVEQAEEFCVQNLSKAGWREAPDARQSTKANGREFRYYLFTKAGHLLSAVIWPADQGGVTVSLSNSGNFDTRTLPRMKDAVLKSAGSGSFPIYTSTIYTTDAKVNEVIDFAAKEISALGWQEYSPSMSSSRRAQGSLYFRNRATRLAVHAFRDRDQPGKTSVSYGTGLLTDDIPAMPDATSLRLEDRSTFHMRFETAAAFPAVIDFYKKELPALGWKYREGAGLFNQDATFFFFDGADKHYLSVDLKPAAGGKTMVSFLHLSPEIEAAAKRQAAPSKAGDAPAAAPVGELADVAVEAAIKKLEGSVHRDKQSPGQPIIAVQLGLSKCTDADLKSLAALKALGSLTLYRTAVTDAGLKELAAIKTLSSLDLGATKITDAGLKELAALPALESLTLNGTKITGAGLKDLAGLKKLRSLSVSNTPLTDDALKGIGALESIRQLDLSRTPMTGSGLSELSRLKSLEVLNLNFTRITDEGLKSLPRCPELDILSLHHTAVTDEGLKGLAGLPSLQHLTLSSTRVTGSGLKDLPDRKSLQRLDLSSAKVTDEGLKGLAGLSGLETLDLDGNGLITDAGLKELAGLTALQSLDLTRTKATQEGVAKLKKELPECQVRQ